MDALQLLDKIKDMDLPGLAAAILSANTDEIEDLNREQLASGISSDGGLTTLDGSTEYKPLTIQIKSEKSGLAAVTDRITGYDTGNMYRNLYARVRGESLEYGSTSATAPLFEDKTGPVIWGLTEENRSDFIENTLEPQFLETVTRLIEL